MWAVSRVRDGPHPYRKATYVADSAFVAKANLAKANAAGLGIPSRLPETFAAGSSVWSAAFWSERP